jgi:hypothetical protein
MKVKALAGYRHVRRCGGVAFLKDKLATFRLPGDAMVRGARLGRHARRASPERSRPPVTV